MIHIGRTSPSLVVPGRLRVEFQCRAAEAVETAIDFEHVYVCVKDGEQFALDLPARPELQAGNSVALHDIAFDCIHQYKADWVWTREEIPAGATLLPGLALKL